MRIKFKFRYNEQLKRFLKNKFLKKIKRERIKYYKNLYGKDKIITKPIPVPKIFSISKNSAKTIKLFEQIREHCKNSKKELVVNMESVEEVDIDALMYLKYIVYEIRQVKRINCYMSFTPPKNKLLHDFIRASGFIKHIEKDEWLAKYKKSISYSTTDNVITEIGSYQNPNFRIRNGNIIDRSVSGSIIDFVSGKVESIGKEILFLYKMLSELMENTVMHAYTDGEKIKHKDWYVFAEKNEKEKKVSFVFLDTGLGIPNTIKGKFFKDIIFPSESSRLLSTLKGEGRTRAEVENRGKGLPFIYKLYLDGKIKNLMIISNQACFNLNNNDDIKKELKGTLFYWEIEREVENVV